MWPDGNCWIRSASSAAPYTSRKRLSTGPSVVTDWPWNARSDPNGSFRLSRMTIDEAAFKAALRTKADLARRVEAVEARLMRLEAQLELRASRLEAS